MKASSQENSNESNGLPEANVRAKDPDEKSTSLKQAVKSATGVYPVGPFSEQGTAGSRQSTP